MEYIRYFTFSFSIAKQKPVFKILLDKKYIDKDKPFFISNNGKRIPLSSSSKKYFDYYFQDESLSNNLFLFRKNFFNLNYCVSFWRDNLNLTDNDYEFCKNYLLKIKELERKNYLLATDKDSFKENMRKSRVFSAEKISKTVKKKFDNPDFKKRALEAMHSEESKKKRIKSFIETMKKEDVKKNFLSALKIRESRLRYSKKRKLLWKSLSSEDRKQRLKNLGYKKKVFLNNFKMNMKEYIVGSILNDLNQCWLYEDEIRVGDKSYYPDFKIESKKIIIECYGTFWHADPRIFSPDSIVISKSKAEDIWERDRRRINDIRSAGYDIIIIWENEIDGCQNNLRSIIKKSIGA